MEFQGFGSGGGTYPLPEQFFTDLLVEIEDLGELKLCLYIFYRLHQQDCPIRVLRHAELVHDTDLIKALSTAGGDLEATLIRAAERGILIVESGKAGSEDERLYFLNTPRSRAAVEGLREGRWTVRDLPDLNLARLERPNIFALYESHIGSLTPMLAESLQDAETTYAAEWIEDAFRIAVENNVRRWRYIDAILKSWQEKGRDDRRDPQSAEKERRKYVEGEFARFIEH